MPAHSVIRQDAQESETFDDLLGCGDVAHPRPVPATANGVVHQAVAGATERREILEQFSRQPVIGVMVQVIARQLPVAAAHLTRRLTTVAEPELVQPAEPHGSPYGGGDIGGVAGAVLLTAS